LNECGKFDLQDRHVASRKLFGRQEQIMEEQIFFASSMIVVG